MVNRFRNFVPTLAPLALLVASACALAPEASPNATTRFFAVPLGASGGLAEDDLTSFLLAPAGSPHFVALDAGTVFAGLQRAARKGAFDGLPLPAPRETGLTTEGWLLKEGIRAWLVSHPHLDHLAGLVIDSPEAGQAPILALDRTIDAMRDHLFLEPVWSNFANEGAERRLGKFEYLRLQPGVEVAVPGTDFQVTPFPLAHVGDGNSTAFLLRLGDQFVLSAGDVGPDEIEKSHLLAALWERVAPLVRTGKLSAIFLECSWPSDRPDGKLFGHLTPRWMGKELRRLATLARPGAARPLEGVTVVVTHIKPSLSAGENIRDRIGREVRAELAPLGATVVVPESGRPIRF